MTTQALARYPEPLPETTGEYPVGACSPFRPFDVTEFYREWIAALRSGAYKQGHFSLRRTRYDHGNGNIEREFCCLGVACDISAVKFGRGEWSDDFFSIGDEVSLNYLPETLAQMLSIEGTDMQPILSSYNDSGNVAFPQIAAMVEAYARDQLGLNL